MCIYIYKSLSLSQLKIQRIVIHSNCVCFKCIIGNKCWYTWSIRVRQDDTIFYTDETGIYSKHYIKCGWIWVCPKNVAFTFKYILWFEERLELWATKSRFLGARSGDFRLHEWGHWAWAWGHVRLPGLISRGIQRASPHDPVGSCSTPRSANPS